LVQKAVLQKRKILVLGDRKEELVAHHETLGKKLSGICVGSLDGRSISQDEKKLALKKQVVLATSQLVKEGLDQPDIDTLVILNPQSNRTFAEQAAGRILRQHAGKQTPLIVVLYDAHCWLDESRGYRATPTRTYPFKATCQQMERHFKALKFNVKRSVT